MIAHFSLRARAGLAALAAAALALAGCTAGTTSADTAPAIDAPTIAADALLTSHDLAGLDARGVIDALDAVPLAERDADLMASIRPDQLLLSDADGTEVSLPMPEDAFYVSIAPYVNDTHDCYYHSLTTCKGEMGGQTVHVTVTDVATGKVILDEDRVAFDNGFVGLWLPRDLDVTVSVEADGRSATAELSTRSVEDATCVTTMQLT